MATGHRAFLRQYGLRCTRRVCAYVHSRRLVADQTCPSVRPAYVTQTGDAGEARRTQTIKGHETSYGYGGATYASYGRSCRTEIAVRRNTKQCRGKTSGPFPYLSPIVDVFGCSRVGYPTVGERERERKRRRLDVHDRVQMWAIFESCMNRAHTPSSSLVPVECGHGGGRYHRGLFRIPARVIRMPWHRFPVVSVLPQSRSVSRARALDSRVVSYLFCHRSFELARIREWQVSYGYSKAILSRSMSSALL